MDLENKTTLAIGCDHVALTLKNEIIDYCMNKGYQIIDVGPYTSDRTDYPIYAKKVADAVNDGHAHLGILICGTGVGMSIAANKINGIRAVVCSEPYSARMGREHNNANILCFGARVVGIELAKMIVDNYLESEYQADRHQNRVDMISEFES